MSRRGDNVALAVLAAGRSRRFGRRDKLMAVLRGQPLCAHVAKAGLGVKVDMRLAIVRRTDSPVAGVFSGFGYTVIGNLNADSGQSSSIAHAASAAHEAGARRLVIALADMPFIASAHLQVVADAALTHDGVMSRRGDVLMPPAAFAASTFPALMSLSGDRGARGLFETLERRAVVSMAAEMARDIDTEADWDSARQEGENVHG